MISDMLFWRKCKHGIFLNAFLKFIFNWRIITLQCCVGVCLPSTWISHKYICVPSSGHTLAPTPSHPPGCHRAPWWAPCVIRQLPTSYQFISGNTYDSMPLSQFVSLSPSPAVSKVCFLCLHFYSCPASGFISTILYIYVLIHICFSLSDLFSLCITGSRFIHFTRADWNVFLFMTKQTFLQRRHTDGQQTHAKMLSIAH